MLKFSRVGTGKYSANHENGLTVIQKEVDGRWAIHFPNGSKFYRESFCRAKVWADLFIKHC